MSSKQHISGGFYIVPRALFESGLWKEPHHLRFFHLLVGKANHQKDKPFCLGAVRVGYGQYLRSYRKLQDDLEYIESGRLKRYSTARVRRMVKQLAKQGMIRAEETELGTLFSVCNYHIYQDVAPYVNSHDKQTPNTSETPPKQ